MLRNYLKFYYFKMHTFIWNNLIVSQIIVLSFSISRLSLVILVEGMLYIFILMKFEIKHSIHINLIFSKQN